jgi:hypothetical protein
MKRVLLIGFDPATVDYSDPALPPGMTAEKIHPRVKLALADLAGRVGIPRCASSTLTTPRSRRFNAAWPVTSTTA